MNKSISNILKVEVFATSPKVALIIPITLQVAVDRGQQSVAPDVKLPVLIEEGFLDVLLDDVGPLLSVNIGIRYDVLDLGEFSANLNATASVSVLTGLDYPNLLP
jgi:hypothetical protein